MLSAGPALAASGCGDDGGGGGRPDARPPADAEPDEPDASDDRPDAGRQADAAGDPDAGEEPTLLRLGTIAVTEAALTNPGLTTFSGALVRVGFSDASTGNIPAPVAGFESSINSCLIRIWDVGTHEASYRVDEGAVQVTGTDNGPFGCAFANGDLGYICQSGDAAIAGGTPGNGDTFVLTGATDTLAMTGFAASAAMRGMHITLTGFPNVPDGTRFPILAVNETTDVLTLFGVPDGLNSTGDADSTFSTHVGVGPVPGGAQFLRGAADAITIQKTAGDVAPPIDEDFNAHGQGFALLDNAEMAQYLPSNLPFDGTEVNFECADVGCGAAGTGGIIAAIAIDGETTDAPTAGLDPSNPMPPPETRYATFQCSFLSSDVATLSADAMAAILGTNPTRIQTTVGRYRGAILAADDGSSSTIVLQGHALLGWADLPAR